MIGGLLEAAFGILNLVSTWRAALCAVLGIAGGACALFVIDSDRRRLITALGIGGLGIVTGVVWSAAGGGMTREATRVTEGVPMTMLPYPRQVCAALLSFTVALVGVCLRPEARGADPLVRTVCELSEHPEIYDGKWVRVAGTVTRDGLERAVIQDASCPKVGLELSYSAAGAKAAAAKRLKEALFPGLGPYENVERVEATLVGTFLFKPAEGHLRMLVIDRVSHLSITHRPMP